MCPYRCLLCGDLQKLTQKPAAALHFTNELTRKPYQPPAPLPGECCCATVYRYVCVRAFFFGEGWGLKRLRTYVLQSGLLSACLFCLLPSVLPAGGLFRKLVYQGTLRSCGTVCSTSCVHPCLNRLHNTWAWDEVSNKVLVHPVC